MYCTYSTVPAYRARQCRHQSQGGGTPPRLRTRPATAPAQCPLSSGAAGPSEPRHPPTHSVSSLVTCLTVIFNFPPTTAASPPCRYSA